MKQNNTFNNEEFQPNGSTINCFANISKQKKKWEKNATLWCLFDAVTWQEKVNNSASGMFFSLK